MKKILLGVLILALALVPQVSFAAVNDFTISNYEMDFYLSRDAGNRSTLKTIEKITAEFPQIDQNHGIERAIPSSYNDHSTSLKIESVTDEAGKKLPYSTYGSDGNEVLRIGDADTYVHGSKTYILTYTQRDVTQHVAESGVNLDEFYWDANGVDWRVPIEQLAVRVHIDDPLASSMTGSRSCYRGFVKSNQQCENFDQEGNTYTITTSNVSPGQTVTFAFGFKPNTFAQYEPSLIEKLANVWLALFLISIPLVIVGSIWAIIRWSRVRNRKDSVGTVVPEYIPPKDASVSAAAEVLDGVQGVMTAQIIDLAVRHYLKIYQTSDKSLFKKAEYDLEIIKKIDDLRWEEQELIRDLFAGNVDIGSRMSMKSLRSGTGFYTRLQNNAPELKKRVKSEYGLRAKDPMESKWFKRLGIWSLIIAVLLLSPLFLVLAIIAFILQATLTPLTEKGVGLRRYAMGLKDYISVAEVERIKMLQSPDGAAKVGETISPSDKGQLVKLYERVLPYAILFGQEKKWNEQLGDYYQSTNSQPSWYVGNNSAFNALAFSSAMHNFSSSTAYVSPSSSSSSGSGGGGFSGGGGGGGGGGGW